MAVSVVTATPLKLRPPFLTFWFLGLGHQPERLLAPSPVDSLGMQEFEHCMKLPQSSGDQM